MNYFRNIGKLYPLLIGLIVFQSGCLCLIVNNSLLHTDKAASAIFQQSPSPIHHDHVTHFMGISELEGEDDRFEENESLREVHLIESTLEDFPTLFFTPPTEENLLSVATLPIYLVDEQFRL